VRARSAHGSRPTAAAGSEVRLQIRRSLTITLTVETPSFAFRLERVRSLRERVEERAREDLARELQLRLRGEALLRQATSAASAARETGRGAVQRAGASGADLLAVQAFIERVESDRRDAVHDLHRQDAEVEARREALTAAARDRQAIDRLRERRRADHNRTVARNAQNALDEIALGVHRRGQVAV
jgi:flagellar FliJ protein